MSVIWETKVHTSIRYAKSGHKALESLVRLPLIVYAEVYGANFRPLFWVRARQTICWNIGRLMVIVMRILQ